MINKTYRKKLDENGEPLIENGDYVMDLVSSEEVPDEVLPPDWLGLEQTLRYFNNSALFNKAFGLATAKGLNLFMTTLLNGKRGDATENALLFAFNCLGESNGYPAPLSWTSQEIIDLNKILTDNHFTIRVS